MSALYQLNSKYSSVKANKLWNTRNEKSIEKQWKIFFPFQLETSIPVKNSRRKKKKKKIIENTWKGYEHKSKQRIHLCFILYHIQRIPHIYSLGQSTLFIDRQSTQRAVNNNGLLLFSSRLLKLHTSNKWSLVLSPDGIHQSHSKSKQEIRHFSTRQY